MANQNELVAAGATVERDRSTCFPEEEKAELRKVFAEYGADPASAGPIVEAFSRDPAVALRVHVREDLGVYPSSLPSPVKAAWCRTCMTATRDAHEGYGDAAWGVTPNGTEKVV